MSDPLGDLEQIEKILVGMGCPSEKVSVLASQLDKRARQLAEAKGRSYESALGHLLGLMSQGWTASGKSEADFQ